ncbi:MAG: hypothetical protein QOG52_1689, partial [Frankiaceae bacterium]|nr:hypothetical protein [Frankiaceae bacterium]
MTSAGPPRVPRRIVLGAAAFGVATGWATVHGYRVLHGHAPDGYLSAMVWGMVLAVVVAVAISRIIGGRPQKSARRPGTTVMVAV